MKISIDVVIPSCRPVEEYLLPILLLARPPLATIKFYLVIDDPNSAIPAAIQSLVNGTDIFLVQNNHNIGAAATRNKGIDTGTGQWVLFLDDDITVHNDLLEIYAEAAARSTNEPGFIGLIELPPAVTAFTQAIQATGAMDVFAIARKKPSHAWGATANMMVSREAMGATRFSLQYPKAGGGEDLDFCLRIREHNGHTNFKCLPEAAVTHPWWNNGQANFKRTFRYGIGNSWLGQLNPRYTYRDFPNTPETLFLTFLLGIPLIVWKPALLNPWLCFLVGVLIIEVLATTLQAIKRAQVVGLLMLGYVIALRFVYETALLWGQLSRFRINGIGERFHDDGRINKLFFYRLNTRKTIKWILYPLLIAFCCR